MKTSFAMLAAAAAVLAAGSAQGQNQDQRYGGGWNGGRVPPGSYQDSCRSVAVRGDNLTASCRDNRGRWNYSSIRFRDCRRDIGNDNGRLVCDYGGGGGYPPGGGGGRPPWGGGGGGGRGGISLFSAPDFGGQQYMADREVTNLPKQYNDRAMSVRIEGRGSWQICSDSDFRGRCQIVDRDIRDLRQFGLGEAISSMRPVGGGRPY